MRIIYAYALPLNFAALVQIILMKCFNELVLFLTNAVTFYRKRGRRLRGQATHRRCSGQHCHDDAIKNTVQLHKKSAEHDKLKAGSIGSKAQ
ncbi:hypothetical protein M5D96_003306 [Drosophila gunungcola]|uniref:Uncharacterized protein n=1 Tax=Drosophila gunungcola TaxID=103775 RepID=A0A9Q0BRZ8_9MUSC|nr:hypothetical protein M5D96_003306 [Drosophila gunungcola]